MKIIEIGKTKNQNQAFNDNEFDNLAGSWNGIVTNRNIIAVILGK